MSTGALKTSRQSALQSRFPVSAAKAMSSPFGALTQPMPYFRFGSFLSSSGVARSADRTTSP